MRLQVKDLAFSYGAGKRDLAEINFSLQSSEIICLLGPNGAGKTTLMRCLTGSLRPTAGTICLNDTSITKLSPRDIAQRMAYVPQATQPAFSHTVREMVLMGRSPHLGRFDMPRHNDHAHVDAAMERVGISHLAAHSFSTISGGERQLCLLARALAQEARILLLDEPAASLDFGNQIKMLTIIAQLARDGFALLMTTHHPDHALQVGTSFLSLIAGRLHASGPVSALAEPGYLSGLYDADIHVIHDSSGHTACVPLLN